MRKYKDLLVDEVDGIARYDIIDSKGVVIANDVKMVIASRIKQTGDSWSAISANLLLEIDDSGIPTLNIDGGTY